MDGEIFDVKRLLIKQMSYSLMSIALSLSALTFSVCAAFAPSSEGQEVSLTGESEIAAVGEELPAVTVDSAFTQEQPEEAALTTEKPRAASKTTSSEAQPDTAESTDTEAQTEETAEDTAKTEETEQTTISETQTAEEVTSEPEPLWTEEEFSGVKYINTDGIYSRIAALMGSAKVEQYSLNDTVNVVAKTDTDYFKLEDGTFIHADYLSDSFVEVTTTTTAQTEPPAADAQIQDKAWEMFRLVNEYRVQNGLSPFQWDYNAYPAAQIRANELLYYNSHVRPNGTRYSTVYDEIGYKPSSSAENIVYYYSSASSALNSLISSPSHRVLILNPKLTHIAIAYVYDPNSYWGYYWVQELTAP